MSRWGHTLWLVLLEMSMTTLSGLLPVFMVLMSTVTRECLEMNLLGYLDGGMFHGVLGMILTSYVSPSERTSGSCSSPALLEFSELIFEQGVMHIWTYLLLAVT